MVEQSSESQQLTPADGAKYWTRLAVSFFGIMISFVFYGLAMEYATSGGRKLHELSLIFVTSTIYTITAYAGRTIRGEAPTTVPTYKLFIVAMLSMGSTFFSVRSLRYVIFPVQVLAKSCKPIPVMLMGAVLGKRYPMKKYINVLLITVGVALFMGGGTGAVKKSTGVEDKSADLMAVGCVMLFLSLSFDGSVGAYEDKIMQKDHVGPFELMFNIQLGKTILAFLGLVFLNEIDYFFSMVAETGPILLILGITGAAGQVFIFVTIANFGALMCSLIGLARKITTLVASILIYQHPIGYQQGAGLILSVGAMIYNFMDKGKKKHKLPSTIDQKDVELAPIKELEPLINSASGEPTSDDDETDDDDTSSINTTPNKTHRRSERNDVDAAEYCDHATQPVSSLEDGSLPPDSSNKTTHSSVPR
uniref:Sugar phosphate transporter domain-containing protein n=1 Tax=Aureoumbra lagunensis TaxID=44058 RepID=A0A7S3K3V6_9STRA|mmetsp:Transcript_20828/g.31889  ORF Transcript_20828/g.31889 Transcript_20828/m.31889 type:complete len:420 (+) Transcript_20828:97-1356(+)